MQASSIDRALYLLRPFRPADAAMRTWPQLPKQQVMATLPTDIQNIWVTAASDESRTTVLLSQWHTRLEDATDITFPTRITGLVDGAYQVDIEWIGAGNEITPGFKTMLVQSPARGAGTAGRCKNAWSVGCPPRYSSLRCCASYCIDRIGCCGAGGAVHIVIIG